MPGYSKRILRLTFEDLTDDPDGDLVWVAIRNPRLVPNNELTPEHVTPVVDGVPEDLKAANTSMHEMIARLVVGWRAYDASQPVELNAVGEDVTPQVLLPIEPGSFTAANVAKLPMEIINAIGREMGEAINPR